MFAMTQVKFKYTNLCLGSLFVDENKHILAPFSLQAKTSVFTWIRGAVSAVLNLVLRLVYITLYSTI